MLIRFSNGFSAGIETLADWRDNQPMNAHSELIMDKATFLRWAEGREGHYELKRNKVVMMTGGTRLHAIITFELASALRQRINRENWTVTASDLPVAIVEDIRYPDVIVEAAGGGWRRLVDRSPHFRR
jgi:hypothetical protein